MPWVPPTPPPGHEDGDSGSAYSEKPPPRPAPAEQGTIGALFEREPVQFSLRGDAHLWRELRARFAATPLPANWHDLRSLLEDAIDKTIGAHPASRESAAWRDADSEIYVPAFDPGHGMSAGKVHLPWWSHTAIPILLDRFQAHSTSEATTESTLTPSRPVNQTPANKSTDADQKSPPSPMCSPEATSRDNRA